MATLIKQRLVVLVAVVEPVLLARQALGLLVETVEQAKHLLCRRAAHKLTVAVVGALGLQQMALVAREVAVRVLRQRALLELQTRAVEVAVLIILVVPLLVAPAAAVL